MFLFPKSNSPTFVKMISTSLSLFGLFVIGKKDKRKKRKETHSSLKVKSVTGSPVLCSCSLIHVPVCIVPQFYRTRVLVLGENADSNTDYRH